MRIDESTVMRVASGLMGAPALSCQRIALGERNYVYEVRSPEGPFILRLTTPERVGEYASALALQTALAPCGVPLAPFEASDLDGSLSPFPALLMRKAPGQDLCLAYAGLSDLDKAALGASMADIQRRAAGCGVVASGCGVSSWQGRSALRHAWADWLYEGVGMSLARWRRERGFEHPSGSALKAALAGAAADLAKVEPAPYLWDASERNVLVEGSRVSAIVDIDDLGFGDDLSVAALTEIALAERGLDRVYTRAWLAGRGMGRSEWRRFALCRAAWALHFLSKNATMAVNGSIRSFDEVALERELQGALAELESGPFAL